MACLLDTNVLIYALAGDIDARILSRIDEAIADDAHYSIAPSAPPKSVSSRLDDASHQATMDGALGAIW